MRLILSTIYLLMAFSGFSWAQDFSNRQRPEINIASPAQTLKTGEELYYTVEWLGVLVGKVVMKIEKEVNFRGRDCYYVSAHAEPNRLLSKIIDLEFRVITYIDKEKIVPLRFEKYRRFDESTNLLAIDFDRVKNVAEATSEGSTRTKIISKKRDEILPTIERTNVITPLTQDILSTFYYFRLLKVEPLKSYPINIYYENSNWDSKFSVGKPYMKEIRKQGSFAVFEATPVSGLNDLIFGKKKFTIVFTADERRLPIEFRFQTGIGSIRCKLQRIP